MDKKTGYLPPEDFVPDQKMVSGNDEDSDRLVCSECAMVGHYSNADDHVKNVIKNEYKKLKNHSVHGKCVICKKESRELQAVSSDVEAALKKIAYSYTFYDKFSRSNKLPQLPPLDPSNDDLPPIDEDKLQNEKPRKKKKKPAIYIKTDMFKDNDRQKQNQIEQRKEPSLPPLPPPVENRTMGLASPTKVPDVDTFYRNFYVNRGMKGSTPRKDPRFRPLGKLPPKDTNYAMYNVGSLGVVYKVPENHHSLVPDSVFKSVSLNKKKKNFNSLYRPFSLLPPIKQKRRPYSYGQYSI